MGNNCVTPSCLKPTPNLRSKIRCMFFCCLRGATINVKHSNHPSDECDGGGTADFEGLKIDSTIPSPVYTESTFHGFDLHPRGILSASSV